MLKRKEGDGSRTESMSALLETERYNFSASGWLFIKNNQYSIKVGKDNEYKETV